MNIGVGLCRPFTGLAFPGSGSRDSRPGLQLVTSFGLVETASRIRRHSKSMQARAPFPVPGRDVQEGKNFAAPR